jgi:hypothetical protein
VTRVEFVEFDAGEESQLVPVMEELSDGSGWLTIDPAIDERFPPPEQTAFGRLLSGRGPAVPRANWVPAELARRRPEPVSVGILHGTGAKAVERLASKEVGVPERWRVVGDHSKRGLVLWVPIDVPHVEVLAWTCRASRALTRIPLTGRWRAAVHRR